jgi:hypothetical protein
MKKFGTPSGAGPGSAKENVGLEGVGTPFLEVFGGGLAEDFLFFFLPPLLPLLLLPPLLFLEPYVDLDPEEAPGLLPEPPPELLWEPEPDDLVVVVLVEVVVVLVDVVVVVVVLRVVVVVEVAGWVQEACTLFTGPVPGGTICEAGVPGGSFTVKVRVCPVSSTTVTVHWSAEATGIEAVAITTSAKPAARASTFSFRPIDTLDPIPPATFAQPAPVAPGR